MLVVHGGSVLLTALGVLVVLEMRCAPFTWCSCCASRDERGGVVHIVHGVRGLHAAMEKARKHCFLEFSIVKCKPLTRVLYLLCLGTVPGIAGVLVGSCT